MSGYPSPTFRYYLGDFNNDFIVDQKDLDVILSKYGTVYDQGDLDEVLAYYGDVYEVPPQPEPQPEPEPEPEPQPEPESEPEAEPEIVPGLVIDGLVSDSDVYFYDLKTKNQVGISRTDDNGEYLLPNGLVTDTFYYLKSSGGENITTRTSIGTSSYSLVTYFDLTNFESNYYNLNIFTTLVAELVNRNVNTAFQTYSSIQSQITSATITVKTVLGLDNDVDFSSFNYLENSTNFDKNLALVSTKLNSFINILSHKLSFATVIEKLVDIIEIQSTGGNQQFSNSYDSRSNLLQDENSDFILFNMFGYTGASEFPTKVYLQRVTSIIDEIDINNTYLLTRLETMNVFTREYNLDDLSNNFNLTIDSDISNNFQNLTYETPPRVVNVYDINEPQPEPEPEPEGEPEPEPEYQHYEPDAFLTYTGLEADRTVREVLGGASAIEPFYTIVTAEIYNDSLRVASNGIPNYLIRVADNVIEGKWNKTVSTADENENMIGEQNYIFMIPIVDVTENPVTSESDDINNVYNTSLHTPIGIAANGIPFYNPWRNDDNDFTSHLRDGNLYSTYDNYGGYITGPTSDIDGVGPYFYQKYPSGLESFLLDQSSDILQYQDAADYLDARVNLFGENAHSPILGYMLDGYPVYGPIGTTSSFFNRSSTTCKIMKSSYRFYEIRDPVSQLITDSGMEYVRGLGDLDKCNAIFSGTPEYPDGCYHYVLTLDEENNYTKRGIRTNDAGEELYQYRDTTLDKTMIQSQYPHTTLYLRGIPGTFTNILGLNEYLHSFTFTHFELRIFYEQDYLVDDFDLSNLELAIRKWDSIVTSVPGDYKIKINVDYKLLEETGVLGYNSTKKLYNTIDDTSSNIIDCEDYGQVYPILNNQLGTLIPIENTITLNTSMTSFLNSWVRSDGNTSYYYTVLHELGHSLGIGALWFLDGTKTTYLEDGVDKYYYTAEHGLREYRYYALDLDNNQLLGIPIEDDGGHGTASVHPEEGDEGHISFNTREVNGVFHPGLDKELMTGFIEASEDPLPLSRMSIAFVHDVGIEVDYTLADDYEIDGYPLEYHTR